MVFGNVRMPSERVRIRPDVAAIVGRILGDLSPEQAAIRSDYRVGKDAIRSLRRGKIGWESTARGFADNYGDLLREHYGEEIAAEFGDAEPKSVSDWFAAKCGFAWKFHLRPEAEELSDLADVDISSYRGAEGLTPDDVRLANELLRTFIRERRKSRGLD